MSIILTPFAKLLLLFYNITGSYGVSIILFGLVVRLVLSPIFLKGRKGMLAMSGLAEKQKVLAQKYARDREKYSQELTKLYEQEGVKPSSGCLWSFLPLPFLMVLYAIIRQPLTYLMNVTEDQFNVISNLLYGEVLNYKNQQLQIAQDVFLNHDKIVAAVPDLAGMPQIDFTFLGVNLSQTPSFMFWKADNVGSAFVLWLIPIVSALLGVVSMIVTNKINADVLGTAKPMDQSTKTTMLIMPLFSLWICFTLPAALGVYWIANSLFAMLQEVVNIPFLRSFLKKQEKDRAERQEQERERIKLEKKAQAEAKRKAQEEMRKIQMERKLNKSIAGASREGIRAYARGRLYDPERYPTFPYQDPNELAMQVWKELEVVTPSTDFPVRRMSGGNVQKVLVGREIATAPSVLMTAYAVRGLDINTSYTIYNLLTKEKMQGSAVIYVGEDLDVLLELCDRILVLCGGKVSGIVDGRTTTKEEVGLLMTRVGGKEKAAHE